MQFCFIRQGGQAPRNLSLEIGDMENCVGVHVYNNGTDKITISIDRASEMADTQTGSLPKGVLASLAATNLTFRVNYVENCKRVADISMDGGLNLGSGVENANLKLHFGMIKSMSAATDIRIDIGATSWGGGVTITGERSGAAQFGVDLRPDATHGLQDIDLSGFKSSGAQYGERWGAVTNAKLRRITSSRDVSATDNDILGVGTGSTNTTDMLILDPTITNASLPGYTGIQRVGSQSQALTDGATITPDFGGPRAGGGNFHVTLGGNRTLANPTNMFAGQMGRIRLTQDGTGNRTLAYGTAWKFPGGAPALSTAPGAVDVIAYYVHSSTLIEAIIAKALA